MPIVQKVTGAFKRFAEGLRDLSEPQPVLEQNHLLAMAPDGRVIPIPEKAVAGEEKGNLLVRVPQGLVRIPLDSIASTSGDLPTSSGKRGALSGGIQGGFAAGVPGIVGGALGGFAGVKAGEIHDSLARALETGASTGAAGGMLTALLVSSLLTPQAGLALFLALVGGGALAANRTPVKKLLKKIGEETARVDQKLHGHLGLAVALITATALGLSHPGLLPAFLATGLAGGLAGAAGTFSGNRLSNVRDRQYGGFLLGGILRTLVPFAPLSLAGGVGSPFGANGRSRKTEALMAFASSFALGLAAAISYGFPAPLIAGAVSGLAGSAGTLLGPRMMQTIRNLNIKLYEKLDKLFGSRLNKLGRTKRVILASTGGALMFATLGLPAALILGPIGAVLPSLIGGIYYGKKAYSAFRDDPDKKPQAA